MIRNVLALAINDLAIALKNKTIYLILFIPFFVFISLNFIDQISSEPTKIKIALIQSDVYDQVIINSIKSAEEIIEIIWVQSEIEGNVLLKNKKIDGVFLRSKNEPDSHVLLVLKRESIQTIAVIESFSALQKVAEGSSPNWIADIEALHAGGIQAQTLPTWILMIVLLIGFIILPAQIAEEKEKKLLQALLQTPMREVEWLIAKVIMGMVLIIIAVLFLHLLGRFAVANIFDYIALIIVGGFCFSAYGIFLGFLCRTQAGARTLGVVFYLPHLLPSALSDFSQQLTAIAPLLPSYQFYEPLTAILLEGGRIANMPFEWIYLLICGSGTFYLSCLLMKRRWLMR